MTPSDVPREDAEFGPRGYLPQRAAKRARKIVLREQMGTPWILAAMVAALIVAVAGALYLRTENRPPGPPFIAITSIDRIPPLGTAVVEGLPPTSYLISRAPGPGHAFVAPRAIVEWCPQNRRFEGTDGSVWTVDGALVGTAGTLSSSLRPVPAKVFDGQVYVDTSQAFDAPPEQLRGEEPMCT